jgi:hypothetical protein
MKLQSNSVARGSLHSDSLQILKQQKHCFEKSLSIVTGRSREAEESGYVLANRERSAFLETLFMLIVFLF